MAERVTLFGDISGINPEYIRAFVTVTNHHLLGGSYPNRESKIPDEEMIARNRDVLAKAGIPDLSPIVLCNSAQERAVAILRYCRQYQTLNYSGNFWILDTNPDTLARAMQSIPDHKTNDPTEKTILESMTILNLGTPIGNDHRDPITGIRVGALPCPLIPYPMHPNPAL